MSKFIKCKNKRMSMIFAYDLKILFYKAKQVKRKSFQKEVFLKGSLKNKNIHRSHVVYKGDCSCGDNNITQTIRNVETGIDEHSLTL